MKTKHGILEAKTRSVLAGFAVLLVAAIFSLSSCGPGAGGGDDGDDTFKVTITGLTADQQVQVSFGWNFTLGGMEGYGVVGYDPEREVTVGSDGSVTVEYSLDSNTLTTLRDDETPIRVEIAFVKSTISWYPTYRSKATYLIKNSPLTVAYSATAFEAY